MDSPLVTHVLNTADGVPAARLAISLHRLDPQMALWNLITNEYVPLYNIYCQKKRITQDYNIVVFSRTTDEHGHCLELITRQNFTVGMYKLRFETGQYWESLGQTSFYPYVEVSKRTVKKKQLENITVHGNVVTY